MFKKLYIFRDLFKLDFYVNEKSYWLAVRMLQTASKLTREKNVWIIKNALKVYFQSKNSETSHICLFWFPCSKQKSRKNIDGCQLE